MNYTKPEIIVLGEAINAIQGNKSLPSGDGGSSENPNPAYDLDE